LAQKLNLSIPDPRRLGAPPTPAWCDADRHRLAADRSAQQRSTYPVRSQRIVYRAHYRGGTNPTPIVNPANCSFRFTILALLAARIYNVSFAGILLVWTAGAGAASLGPTPGGIGVVEIAMIAALRAAGANPVRAVTAVIVYPLISLKEFASLWAGYYAWRESRRQRAAAVAVAAPD
jgi:Lysylphosphatidylglycerol synthase TM region